MEQIEHDDSIRLIEYCKIAILMRKTLSGQVKYIQRLTCDEFRQDRIELFLNEVRDAYKEKS